MSWKNKITGLGYILGWITAREFEYGLHYLAITTFILVLIYHKMMWKSMKDYSKVFSEEVMEKEKK